MGNPSSQSSQFHFPETISAVGLSQSRKLSLAAGLVNLPKLILSVVSVVD